MQGLQQLERRVVRKQQLRTAARGSWRALLESFYCDKQLNGYGICTGSSKERICVWLRSADCKLSS